AEPNPQQRIEEVLSQLPPKQRMYWEAVMAEGELSEDSVRKIGRKLGVSGSMVHKGYNAAEKKIAKITGREPLTISQRIEEARRAFAETAEAKGQTQADELKNIGEEKK